VDDDGYVWVSTVDKGVYRSLSPINVDALRAPLGGVGGREVMRRVFAPAWTTANGAPTNSMRALLWHRGKLWVGTSVSLSVLDVKPQPHAVTTLLRPALGGGLVVGMAAAPNGIVWVSNNAGLVAIDPGTLRVIGRVTKDDGLIDDEAWAHG